MADKCVNSLQGAAKAATYNMVLQVSFRLITFAMNAAILRFISKELLGIVNVRLTLLYSTILFMSREAFRKACLSRGEKEKNWKKIINLVWFAVPVGIIISSILCIAWIRLLELPSMNFQELYVVGVLVFALSAMIELVTEPLYIAGQEFLFIRTKVIIEGLALAFKCGTTVLFVVVLPERNLRSFCIAQIVHSLVYTSSFYVFYGCYTHVSLPSNRPNGFPFQSVRDFFPSLKWSDLPDPLYAKLVWSFLTQSLLKQFLTEGERYVMTLFRVLSLSHQGVYDVINNLGSLVARFVFLPIEDSYYTFFSQILVRGKYGEMQETEATTFSAKALSSVLKFVVLLGITIVTFGYGYSYLLLEIYGGKILSSNEGPSLLRWYCIYVLVIAVNGITECFMFATMSQLQVTNYNRKMLLFSAAFLASTLILTHFMGSSGFILANCLNMIMRIFHSVRFIKRFYQATKHRPLVDAVPRWPVLILFVFSLLATAVSEQLFCCDQGIKYAALHVAIGGGCLSAVAISVLYMEKEFLLFLKDQWTGKLKIE